MLPPSDGDTQLLCRKIRVWFIPQMNARAGSSVHPGGGRSLAARPGLTRAWQEAAVRSSTGNQTCTLIGRGLPARPEPTGGLCFRTYETRVPAWGALPETRPQLCFSLPGTTWYWGAGCMLVLSSHPMVLLCSSGVQCVPTCAHAHHSCASPHPTLLNVGSRTLESE